MIPQNIQISISLKLSSIKIPLRRKNIQKKITPILYGIGSLVFPYFFGLSIIPFLIKTFET